MYILGVILEILHVCPEENASQMPCIPPSHLHTHLINMLRSLTKSQWSLFSTSTTPQGYSRPRTRFPFTSSSVLLPTMEKGTDSYTHKVQQYTSWQGNKATHLQIPYLCAIIFLIIHFSSVNANAILLNLIHDLQGAQDYSWLGHSLHHITYLQLERLELRGSQGVSFGYHWNNIHQVMELLHEFYIEWLQAVIEYKGVMSGGN